MNAAYILSGVAFTLGMFALASWCRKGGLWKWRAVSVAAERFNKERTCFFIACMMRAVGVITGGVLITAGVLDNNALAAGATSISITIALLAYTLYLALRPSG